MGANAAGLIYGQKVNPGQAAANAREQKALPPFSIGKGKPNATSDITGIKDDMVKQNLGEKKLQSPGK